MKNQVMGDFLYNFLITFLDLFQYVALLLVIFYIFFRTNLLNTLTIEKEKGTASKWKKAFRHLLLIVTFGIFAIYSTFSGFKIAGAIANTRDLAPMIAGLLGGPIPGLGAGLIGGIHRIFYGGMTAVPCGFATIIAGLVGGLIHYFRKGKMISPLAAFITGSCMEVFHMGLVLLISKPFNAAWDVVRTLSIQMIIVNAFGFCMFSFLVNHLKRQMDLKAEKEKIENELDLINSLHTTILPDVSTQVLNKVDDKIDIEILFPFMILETYMENDILFKKDDDADKLFYIKDGTVEFSEINKKATKGEVIGETGIFSPFQKRTATARCVTGVEAYSIGKEEVTRVLYTKPALMFDLLHLSIRRFSTNLKDTISEKERIASELKIARGIQTSALPQIFPPFPGRKEFDIFAIMEPALEVGGDFYDFFFIEKNKLCFLIADVSGKGIPGALFMMKTKTLIKTESLRNLPPGDVLQNVNRILIPDNEECMFVTVFYALLDTKTGELQFANAGHNPPLVCIRDDGFKYLEVKKGFVLGAMESIAYTSQTISMKPGDSIFLYTDGVTEAMNKDRNQFSTRRLKDILADQGKNDVHIIIGTVKNAVSEFTDSAEQSDDITMVVLRYNGG